MKTVFKRFIWLAVSASLFGACAAHERVVVVSPPVASTEFISPCRGGVLVPGHLGPGGYWIGEHWDCPAPRGPGRIAVFIDPRPHG